LLLELEARGGLGGTGIVAILAKEGDFREGRHLRAVVLMTPDAPRLSGGGGDLLSVSPGEISLSHQLVAFPTDVGNLPDSRNQSCVGSMAIRTGSGSIIMPFQQADTVGTRDPFGELLRAHVPADSSGI
jgi:hypothetical protein